VHCTALIRETCSIMWCTPPCTSVAPSSSPRICSRPPARRTSWTRTTPLDLWNLKHLRQKGLRALVLRFGEDLARAAGLDDDAGIHEHQGVANLASETHLVSDDDHG